MGYATCRRIYLGVCHSWQINVHMYMVLKKAQNSRNKKGKQKESLGLYDVESYSGDFIELYSLAETLLALWSCSPGSSLVYCGSYQQISSIAVTFGNWNFLELITITMKVYLQVSSSLQSEPGVTFFCSQFLNSLHCSPETKNFKNNFQCLPSWKCTNHTISYRSSLCDVNRHPHTNL